MLSCSCEFPGSSGDGSAATPNGYRYCHCSLVWLDTSLPIGKDNNENFFFLLGSGTANKEGKFTESRFVALLRVSPFIQEK